MNAFSVLVLCALLAAPGCASSGASGGAAKTAGRMRAQGTTDDATITARVKTVLLNDPKINATRIDVAASDGVVTISGSVKSQDEVDRAVQLVRSVAGVKDVRPNLQVGG